LLFYKKVTLVIDFQSLHAVLERATIDDLLELLRGPSLSAVWCDDTIGIQHTREGAIDVYTPIAFFLSGDAENRKYRGPVDRIQLVIERLGMSRSEAKKMALLLARNMPVKKLAGDSFVRGGALKSFTSDITSGTFSLNELVTRAVEISAPSLLPKQGLNWESYLSNNDSILVFTNLEIKPVSVNSPPGLNEISISSILAELLSSHTDSLLAGHFGGDLYTSQLSSSLIRFRHEAFLRRTELNSSQKASFLEAIFPEGRALREAIDSGARSFKEFMTLLRKAERFREFIHDVDPDEELLKEYLQQVHSDPWITSLPAKTIRLIVTTGIGFGSLLGGPVISLASGPVASALDTFLTEKISGGWRPNQFVAQQLLPFVSIPEPSQM